MRRSDVRSSFLLTEAVQVVATTVAGNLLRSDIKSLLTRRDEKRARGGSTY